MYSKTAKYISWALLIIGAVICILGFAMGFGKNDATLVDTLLYYAYAICGIAILAILILIIYNGIRVNLKGLLWGVGVVVVAVIVVGAIYVLSPGNLPDVWNGGDVSTSWLKITDTFLVLMYALVGVAVCSIIVAVIVNAARK